MPTRRRGQRRPNIILLGIDSLRADHMSCYGYPRLTTPHMDRFAQRGHALRAQLQRRTSPPPAATPPCSPAWTCSRTQVVALRHKGPLRPEVKTLPEILREEGYDTTCVGFSGNPASRGFDTYLDFPGWGSWNEGRSPKAENLNEVAIPELDRLAKQKAALLPLPAPHGPARALPAARAL